jgi:AcrR family transcriptional regulator
VSGRRQDKKLQTRTRLQTAAFELFLRQGYDNTSVTELAAAADVAERTFFRYFATKDDVLFGQLDESLEEYLAFLRAELVSVTPLWSDLARGLEAFCRHYEPLKEVTSRRSQLIAQTPALADRAQVEQARWRRCTALLLAEQYGRPAFDLDVQLLAGTVSTVIVASFGEWVRSELELHDIVGRATNRIDVLLQPRTPGH